MSDEQEEVLAVGADGREIRVGDFVKVHRPSLGNRSRENHLKVLSLDPTSTPETPVLLCYGGSDPAKGKSGRMAQFFSVYASACKQQHSARTTATLRNRR